MTDRSDSLAALTEAIVETATKVGRKRDPRPVMVIEWVDASRLNDGWIDLSDIPDPYTHRCVSVGFLASRNERGVILIPTIGDIDHPENSHTYGGMMIPAASIVSERELR